MDKHSFIKGVEKLINPIDVGTIHFIQYFNKFIPKSIQKKMANSSGKKTPYMGFVVEPYSIFLCYEIKNIEKAKTLLPKDFKMIKTKIFEDDEPKYYSIFGCINAHTSGFWGSRVEFYIIAQDTNTGLLSWVIVDYDTNTVTYDPKNGFSDPSVKNSVITIDYSGELYVDLVNLEGRKLIFNSDIKQGKMKNLDQRLWVEGNLSIAYGKNKSEGDSKTFSLTFDPREFKSGLRIPIDSVKIHANDWFVGLFNDEPSEVVCFPYAQHFLSDSPGHFSNLKSEADLIKALDKVDFNDIKTFSTKGFKIAFLVLGLVSLVIVIAFICIYIYRLYIGYI